MSIEGAGEWRWGADHLRRWQRLMEKIERVQVMEKERFFAVVDPLPRGEIKDATLALWQAS